MTPVRELFGGLVVRPRYLAKTEGADTLPALAPLYDGHPMKTEPGRPMTLGNAAAAHVRLIVWCLDCSHQIEPDPAEMAARFLTGADHALPGLKWRD